MEKRRWPLIILCCLFFISLGCNIWLLKENRQLLASWQPANERVLQVHVTGAVARPGVYSVDVGARVADALNLAGGTLPEAWLGNLNLAKPLFDGEQVYIAFAPSQDGNDDVLPAHTAKPLVNLNTASAVELQTLPGIGPAKAQAIINYRQQHGAFARIEDLMKVSGIGEKTFAQLKDLITVR